MARRQIAVIGAGVSGLTAAYLLQRAADVTLYEADGRLGGHAHTHELWAAGQVYHVDSGFIVHNERTYPTLLRLFDELGVQTQESEMSISIRCDGCGLEYAGGRGLTATLDQPTAALRAGYLSILRRVPDFHRQARALVASAPRTPEPTLGDFLTAGGFSGYFATHFIVPLVSAVWSCGSELAAQYPARYLYAFLDHHGMLAVSGSPHWRTVVGGSRRYVEAAAKGLTATRTSTPVRSVRRGASRAWVHDDADTVAEFDAVVIATPADQALHLLAEPSTVEREVLGSFTYSRNDVVLHTDETLLPRRDNARASWNYVQTSCTPPPGPVRMNYDMNRLHRLDAPVTYVVTLNDEDRIAPERVLDRMVYYHPVFTPTALAAQQRLPSLTTNVTAFAGAYHGWGFHEDGARSGAEAARSLGVGWL